MQITSAILHLKALFNMGDSYTGVWESAGTLHKFINIDFC